MMSASGEQSGIFSLIYQISKIFTEKFVLFEIGCAFDLEIVCFLFWAQSFIRIEIVLLCGIFRMFAVILYKFD